MYLSRIVFYNVEDRQLLYPHTFAIKKEKGFSKKLTCVTSVTSDSLSTGSVSPTLAYRITQTVIYAHILLEYEEADTYNFFLFNQDLKFSHNEVLFL